MSIRHVLVLLSALATAGCATSYQDSGLTGGFSETQLSENIFRVKFQGNGFTNSERAADFALLRSAELTRQNGYSYFAIVEEGSAIDKSYYTSPTTTSATASTYGNTTHTTARTSGGQIHTITKPRSEMTIVLFHEQPRDGIAYSADFVFREIREKYNLENGK